MRVLLLLALGLGIGTAWAQAAEPAGKGGKARVAVKAPAEEVEAADEGDALPADEKDSDQPSGAEMKELLKKASYVFGTEIGRNVKAQKLDLDLKQLSRGIEDAVAGKEPEMSEEEMQQVMASLQQIVVARQREMVKTAGDKHKKEGAQYLAANKKKEGVKTTESGLQYKVLKKGKGESPKDTDTVKTHYKGTLIDGTEFDSSYKRGEPATFPVNGVIPGWTEALQLMKVGDKWQLFIPAELAYGAQGSPPVIPPNATLVFEIELLDIEE